MSNLEPNHLLEEARRLLPWYLTDKLGKAEQSLVHEALEAYPELQRELAQEEKMMRLVRTNTSLLELSALDTTEQRLTKLLASIEREVEKEELNQAEANTVPPVLAASPAIQTANPIKKKSWWQLFWHEHLLNWNWLTPANAVFAGLVLAQVALLIHGNFAPSTKTQYTVANVEDIQKLGDVNMARFLVQFANDAQHGEVCEFLNQIDAHIIAGPNAQNIFTIELRVAPNTDKLALAERIKQTTARSSPSVLFLEPQFQD